MVTRRQLKERAKEQIKGNIGMLLLCAIIASAITSAAGATVIGIIIAPIMEMGLVIIYLGVAQGKKPQVTECFEGFNFFGKTLWLSILTGIFVMLWSLLLVIPGLIKAYSYSMARYILAENRNLTAREAIGRSKEIMHGHKWELFVLQLSFIGWCLLGVITVGIAYIYVVPYMETTMVNFYHEINADNVAPVQPVA